MLVEIEIRMSYYGVLLGYIKRRETRLTWATFKQMGRPLVPMNPITHLDGTTSMLELGFFYPRSNSLILYNDEWGYVTLRCLSSIGKMFMFLSICRHFLSRMFSLSMITRVMRTTTFALWFLGTPLPAPSTPQVVTKLGQWFDSCSIILRLLLI